MNKRLLVVLSAFGIPAVLGFINGRSAVNKPEYVKEYLMHHLHLDRDRGMLRFFNGNDVVYEFDVETNTPAPTDAGMMVFAENEVSLPLPFPVSEATIISLLGGPAGGLTVTRLSRLKDRAVVVVGIASALTGFALGYKVGTLMHPPFYSRDFKTILESKDEWMEIERSVFDGYFLSNLLARKKLRDAGMNDQCCAFDPSRLARVMDQNDVRLDDLIAIMGAHEVLAKDIVGEMPLSPRVDLNSISEPVDLPFWLSWWFLGLLMLLSLSIAALWIYWDEI